MCSLLCCCVSRPVYVGLLAQYICLLYSMHTPSTEEEESCNRQWGKGLEKTQRIQILDCITLDFITLLFCPHICFSNDTFTVSFHFQTTCIALIHAHFSDLYRALVSNSSRFSY